MNEAGKHITEHLFGKQDLSQVSSAAIEKLTKQYPYFAVPQYLLAKKLLSNNTEEATAQIRKTALHFNSPYWLNYLLNEDAAIDVFTFDEETGIIQNEEPVDSTTDTADVESISSITDELPPVEEKSATIIEHSFTEIPEKDEIVPAIEVTAKEMAAEPADEIIPAIEIPEEGVINETDEVVPAIEVNAKEMATEPADEIVPAIELPEEGVVNETDEIVPAVEVTKKEMTTEPPDEIIPAVEITKENSATEFDNEPADELNEEPLEAEETNTRLKLSSLIEQHLSDFKKPVAEDEVLPIKANPFHTVDYFASQGIKADEQDKMTYRVRKFTDWLKQIKVKNPQPQDLGTDIATEKLIETIAATSNEQKDVVTEAMAEVLVKQGKTDKAIQLYKKLGLLNPDKSAYFAAKIDSLNNK